MSERRDRRDQKYSAISTVNAPAKKSGGGGSYTWGNAMDVTDYEPVGTTMTKVQVAAAPLVVQSAAPVAGPTMTANFVSSDFPQLGSPAPVATRPAWGPPPAPISIATRQSIMMSEHPVRIVESGFDAQHPRNAFARVPRTTSSPVIDGGGQPLAIDWTQSGTTALQQQVLQASANPAHLGPYVQKKPAVTMAILQQTPQASVRQHIVPAATRGYPTTYQTKPRPLVLQPRGR
eukprot:TRINITY_DN5484_c0_g1_i1.p1 TRINITY_DN5484_c0_g1~~TRINITY_DN5484_c0_g1_i1.p1  ORF type:complete len:233 (-),score=26.60 TRINITY_DN5484_c0_g1_i1:146-844(-)